MTLPVIIPDDLLQHATLAELDAYEAALKQQLALTSPLDYALFVSPAQALAFRHTVLLNEWLMALIEGRLYRYGPGPMPVIDDEGTPRHPVTGEKAVYRLTISMPPRHGKSFIVSDHLPAWFLTVFPMLRAVLASYEADFAASWGLKARTHVQEHPELGVIVSDETRSGARWNLKGNRGGMVTAGAGGALTGKGAHLFIIDDPIKNAEEAFSAVQRKTLYEWYLSTAYTRLEAWPCEPCRVAETACTHDDLKTPGRMILMNTRWHEDDLNGRVTLKEPEEWAVLNLPAVAEDNDQMGRERSEPLCPELFNTRALATIKAAQTDYFWSAMYQGRPNIEGGGLLSKPYRYHRLVLPEGGGPGTYEATTASGAITYIPEASCFRFATMDVAGSVKTSADWTVYSVWDLSPGGLLMLHDRKRVRMETPDHEEKLREWYAEYPRTKFVGIENKTFGTQLIKAAVRHGGMSIRPLEADTDKVARAIPYGAKIKTGQVSFPADAEWLPLWEHEHLQFPNGTHDDQVDTGAYAAQIADLMPGKAAPKQEPTTYDEKVHAMAERRFGKKKSGRRHGMLGRM